MSSSTFQRLARRAPCHDLMGREIRRAEPGSGEAELEFVAREEFTNGMGNIQGGILGALLDSTMGCALVTLLDEDEVLPSLELKVSFIRPAKVGPISGRARVVHRGGTVAFAEGELRDPAGQLIATASSTFRILRAR